MKNNYLFSITALLLLAVSFAPRVQADEPNIGITVDGLACPFCVFGVEKKLKKVDGVKAVEIDLKTGLALVTLNEGVTPDVAALQNAVKKAGFTPRKVQMTAVGKILIKGDKTYIALRDSEDKYLLYAANSTRPALPEELSQRLTNLVADESLVAITGTPHIRVKNSNGLSVDSVVSVTSVTLSVEGLACDKCVARLTGLFEKIDGVSRVSVSLSEKRAVVESIGEPVPTAQLITTADDAGFKATVDEKTQGR